MRIRSLFLIIPVLAMATHADAGMISFDDLTDTTSVTFQGLGNRITNFVQTAESTSFDVSTSGNNFITTAGFTNLLDPAGSDDLQGTVSDRIVLTFTAGANTYHVEIGSDPELPAVPANARDLTAIPEQGLPSPYFENGDFQKVATVFANNGAVLDTFFIRSDVSPVPEPGSMILLGMGLGLCAIARRRWGC